MEKKKIPLLEEFKETFSLKEDQQAAQLLGKDPSTVSKWIAAGEIPPRMEREMLTMMRGATVTGGNVQNVVVGDQKPIYDDEIAAVIKILKELSPKSRYKVLHFATELRISENGDSAHPK